LKRQAENPYRPEIRYANQREINRIFEYLQENVHKVIGSPVDDRDFGFDGLECNVLTWKISPHIYDDYAISILADCTADQNPMVLSVTPVITPDGLFLLYAFDPRGCYGMHIDPRLVGLSHLGG
jgi:hypothetical protein